MTVIENHCVDCGLPCVSSCRYKKVAVTHCDVCGGEAAVQLDGEDLCEKCFLYRLDEEFQDLTWQERARILGIKYELI